MAEPRRHEPVKAPEAAAAVIAEASHQGPASALASGQAGGSTVERKVTMSAATESGPDDDELAPIDFLAVEFPGARITSRGFEQLLALADAGVIGILDMEFVASDGDGNARKVGVEELSNPGGADLSAWTGASSGLLDDTDLQQIAAAIRPGSVAAIVVYENRWVLGVVDAWRREGARLIADGGLSAEDLVAALDATEPS